MLLDEVFGAENRVATIPYATTSVAHRPRRCPSVADFLLWYVKGQDSRSSTTSFMNPLTRAEKASCNHMSSWAANGRDEHGETG